MSDTKQPQEQFPDTPAGNASRWKAELSASRKSLEKWHTQGRKVVRRFLDKRGGVGEKSDTQKTLNLFPANIQTLRALLFGKTPAVDVSRKFADADDDVARVAAEMLERVLNCDAERDSDSYAEAIGAALDDRLLPGLGAARVRYEAEFEQRARAAILDEQTGMEVAPAISEDVKTKEEADTDYLHWDDVLWSPARTWGEVTWLAFRAKMPRSALIERFGQEIGPNVPLDTKKENDEPDSPWDRADVWEVWDKESRRVFWVSEGYATTLDMQDDTLGLEGFFPAPRPMAANLTTDAFIPTPDFVLAQDQYNTIDELTERIDRLQEAVKVAGVYDKTAAGVAEMLNRNVSNKLIPVENWAMFAENGGVRGQIDWLPIDMVVGALDKLREVRSEEIQLLFQVTGMSDIMRGQASANSTATEQSIKAKFASVRVQALQDEFARFATDVQRLKAEIIAKHFDAATIIAKSNILRTKDAPYAQQAAELIKSEFASYRIEVKPENVSLTDFAALKAERTEFMQALSGFITAMTPLAQSMPTALPYLLELLQWSMAGFKGSSTAEGILDRAIDGATKMAAQPQQQQQQPDPKLLAAQAKAQGDMQKAQAELQADLMRTKAQTQANMAERTHDARMNILETQATERAKAVGAVSQVTGTQGWVP